jgi:membrane dipeptidase
MKWAMTTDARPDRRTFLTLAAGALAAAPTFAQRPRAPATPSMLIVNALGGFSDPNPPRPPASVQPQRGAVLAPRLIADARASGMNVVNQTIGYVAGDGDPFEDTMREIGIWDARFAAMPNDLLHVRTAADMLRARRENRIGVILGFQNAAMVGNDATRIDIFADMGIRVIQLTYNPPNQIGDGSIAPDNRGLTPFGREVVARLNDRKVMVDLSHSGEQTCLEAARISRQPISINHTGCRALVDMPRNKTNAELRLVAERGGFVGIYFMPFLSPDSVATAADVVAHIDHAINTCGEDHVGIGTDGGTTGIDDMAAYREAMRVEVAARHAAGIGAAGENPDTLPFVADLSGPDQFHRLIRLLDRRGYSTGRIEKVMGLNFLAYARAVWGA